MRVLISAYACEPGKGSEPGAGWNWALAAAHNHEVWVLTRANNRASIEQALTRRNMPPLHVVYLDFPRWARFWKRGGRGVRLYYVLWQLLAAREARRLHREHTFDLVHHITFANAWLPALAAVPDAPFVLGPVGGGPRVPLRLYGVLGPRGALRELLLVGGRWLSRVNPLTRGGWKRAAVILVQNEETRAALPRRYRHKARVRPNASIEEPLLASQAEKLGRPTAICAGRLLPWKGVSLAILALRALPAWRLLVVGSGPGDASLRRLVARHDLGERVEFIPWLPQSELWLRLASCRAMILPSLRDDASFISVEAQALGVPVVAFGRGGPAVLARFPGTSFELAPIGSKDQCVRALADALLRLEGRAPAALEPEFTLEGITRDLDQIYAIASRPGAPSSVEATA